MRSKTYDYEPSKIYWSVMEVAQVCEVEPSKVRFYTKRFQIMPKRLNRHGAANALYTMEQIDFLRKLLQMTKYFHLHGLLELYFANRLDGAYAWIKKVDSE